MKYEIDKISVNIYIRRMLNNVIGMCTIDRKMILFQIDK